MGERKNERNFKVHGGGGGDDDRSRLVDDARALARRDSCPAVANDCQHTRDDLDSELGIPICLAPGTLRTGCAGGEAILSVADHLLRRSFHPVEIPIQRRDRETIGLAIRGQIEIRSRGVSRAVCGCWRSWNKKTTPTRPYPYILSRGRRPSVSRFFLTGVRR